MSINTKFSFSQDKDTKLITISVFRKYGDKPDDWICYDEKIEDLTVEEIKGLQHKVNGLFEKKN